MSYVHLYISAPFDKIEDRKTELNKIIKYAQAHIYDEKKRTFIHTIPNTIYAHGRLSWFYVILVSFSITINYTTDKENVYTSNAI